MKGIELAGKLPETVSRRCVQSLLGITRDVDLSPKLLGLPSCGCSSYDAGVFCNSLVQQIFSPPIAAKLRFTFPIIASDRWPKNALLYSEFARTRKPTGQAKPSI